MGIETKFPLNTSVLAKVTNLTDYGFFAEIENGVEGLVHVSEIDWTNKNIHPSKVVQLKDQVEVMSYLNDPEARKVLPSQFRYARFVWGKPAPNSELSDLYALQSNRNNLAPLSGGVVDDAVQSYNQIGLPAVSMQMNASGSRTWENMTGKAFREGGFIAIVLDDVVYSAPGVSSGAITGGRSEITGDFTLNEFDIIIDIFSIGFTTPSFSCS